MTDRVVTADIPLGDPGRGVYAYRVGDKVSADEVKANGWEAYTAAPSTKAAQDATATAAGDSTTSGKGK